MATPLDNFLSVIANASRAQLKVLSYTFGVPADIYYPVSAGTLLDDDSKFTYNDTPDESRNILLVGVFGTPYQGFGLEETLSQDEEAIWYLSGDETPPPLNSKVVVHIGDKDLTFMVSFIKDDPTLHGAYYEIHLTRMR